MPNTALQCKTTRLDRVAARVPEDVKKRWQRAATMRGQTLTDFLIVAANTATDETFLEHERIELSQRDQIKLAEMLVRPPKINAAMSRAIQTRLEHMQAG